MGKARKHSRGMQAVERDDFGYPRGTDSEMEEEAPVSKRSRFSLNGGDRFGVPKEVLSLSNMLRSEREHLVHKLRMELEQVRELRRKVECFSSDKVMLSPYSDLHSCSDGSRRMPTQGKKRRPLRNDKQRNVTTSSTVASLMKECQTLVDRLWSHKLGFPFRIPVDPVLLNIPDYFTVIKHPMDLGTIRSRLRNGEYSSPLDFAADVRLTFSNSMAYNPPGNQYHKMARDLSTLLSVFSDCFNSTLQPSKGDMLIDEDVDIIGGNDPPVSSHPPHKIDKDAACRNNERSSSSSSSRDSGSSSSDSDSCSSSRSETDFTKASNPTSTEDKKEPGVDINGEKIVVNDSLNELCQVEHDVGEKSAAIDAVHVIPEEETAPCERQDSPGKRQRAALLKNRFADTIMKAREKTLTKGEKGDPEKLRIEREKFEKRLREENLRLQAEAKAVEEARRKAKAEAAEKARREREQEREAARQALQKLEKTVEIDEGRRFMEDLEMLRATGAEGDQLPTFMEEMSPKRSPDMLGSFKMEGNSNPLEQLGLYMKMDEDEDDEEDEPHFSQGEVDEQTLDRKERLMLSPHGVEREDQLDNGNKKPASQRAQQDGGNQEDEKSINQKEGEEQIENGPGDDETGIVDMVGVETEVVEMVKVDTEEVDMREQETEVVGNGEKETEVGGMGEQDNGIEDKGDEEAEMYNKDEETGIVDMEGKETEVVDMVKADTEVVDMREQETEVVDMGEEGNEIGGMGEQENGIEDKGGEEAGIVDMGEEETEGVDIVKVETEVVDMREQETEAVDKVEKETEVVVMGKKETDVVDSGEEETKVVHKREEETGVVENGEEGNENGDNGDEETEAVQTREEEKVVGKGQEVSEALQKREEESEVVEEQIE
ncbi:BnaCnng15810D [Brassica napus]|uniref:BnaCnng15810D protein n=1 Tax=Brassica napus TaxID=3708 RepID=A0A078IFP6_BRANA|nr:BnaCnng15810D [Brassica napus]